MKDHPFVRLTQGQNFSLFVVVHMCTNFSFQMDQQGIKKQFYSMPKAMKSTSTPLGFAH